MSLLLLKVVAYTTIKQLQVETCKLLFDITVRRALREVGLDAQVQQKEAIYES